MATAQIKDPREVEEMTEEEREELDRRAWEGETVVHGGTRGTRLEAQINLAEGSLNSLTWKKEWIFM